MVLQAPSQKGWVSGENSCKISTENTYRVEKPKLGEKGILRISQKKQREFPDKISDVGFGESMVSQKSQDKEFDFSVFRKCTFWDARKGLWSLDATHMSL